MPSPGGADALGMGGVAALVLPRRRLVVHRGGQQPSIAARAKNLGRQRCQVALSANFLGRQFFANSLIEGHLIGLGRQPHCRHLGDQFAL